jgi:hypothetical protein
MTTVAILPISNASGERSYRAIAGDKQSVGKTAIRQTILTSHVFIPANTGGLKQDSVILCEQIRVIDKLRINKIIGHLENDYLVKL